MKKPSIFKMGKDLFFTATETIDLALRGGIKSSLCGPEEIDKRLEICSTCSSNKEGWCQSCGCYLKVKTAVKKSKCPEDKWMKKDDTN